ncbi:hypothetical protein D3H65_09955 [Paraflavitalea soli]|uniref:DUF2946 domain-containing protein n=1 Tax=Paraflavitalea soli TaxID=2315862 RepID=A0A3B7MJB5_9BACT|nr:hypothetical protein [Paraflavitalea soli]AXY74278.1 hypothetical protein D3H65_09955 [Paraflavitalea soli]
MRNTRHAHTKQLISALLMMLLVLVHLTKALHIHPSGNTGHHCHQENIITKATMVHGSCAICEFQLAKDAPFTGEVLLVIAPVHIAPTYTGLLTSINPSRLFTVEGRGPPLS